MPDTKEMVRRSDKKAFFGTGEGVITTYDRMFGFTEMNNSKNPKEYTRQYVDELYEQTDVTGYSPSMSFGFDQYTNDPVHADIAGICDNEKTGKDAIRSIVIVDFTQAGTAQDTFIAKKRDFVVVVDSEGDSLDAYTYSGTFKTKGETVWGTAATTDEWETCTFTPNP